jgi:hypothetical protein
MVECILPFFGGTKAASIGDIERSRGDKLW